ncbi:hypothetical protein [Xanthomonas bromi]|uniref:hypothetical protein n=1 Tax=Xanthomonas bromi TaxID=56449 RepID=UPI0015E311D1|nr:hypothetical protein [Xanthomonas bromi]
MTLSKLETVEACGDSCPSYAACSVDPATLGLETHRPILISNSDLKNKSGEELSGCRWFTEVMFGNTKDLRWRPAYNAIVGVLPSLRPKGSGS